MTTGPILIHRQRIDRLRRAVADLNVGAPTALFEGVAYRAADLPKLYTLSERLGVKAAIEAVENNQSYTLNGVAITRAMLPALQARETALEQRAATSAAVGSISVRYMRQAR